MDRFSVGLDETFKVFPQLRLMEDKTVPYIAGEINITDTQGCVLDSYQIEIYPSDNYPYMFPDVFETGGKIPRDVDWHIYPASGRCCVKIPPEETLICKGGITMIEFISGQLIPYLFNQTFRRENGYYINERSHGAKGFIEYYGEVLKISRVTQIVAWLKFIIRGEEPNRVAMCPCGSNIKYRNCHRQQFRMLSLINKEDLAHHTMLIIDYAK